MIQFNEIDVKDLDISPSKLKREWMLVTAGEGENVNAMTANWGGFGILWNKTVAYVVLRPQRYTKKIVDNAEGFSLAFFGSKNKKDLSYLGKISANDVKNKLQNTSLTIANDGGIPYPQEAEIVVFVKKLFVQELNAESFLDKDILTEWYPNNDIHTLYVAEVTKVLVK